MNRIAWMWTAAAVVAMGILGTLAAIYLRTSTPLPLGWEQTQVAPDRWTRPAVLWFGDPGHPELRAERREILDEATMAQNVTRLLNELARGPEGGGVALLAPGCRVRSVFEEPGGGVVIDFAGSPLPSGAGEITCRLGLESILRVLAARFPELVSVVLLGDGIPLAETEDRLDVPRSIPLAPVRARLRG